MPDPLASIFTPDALDALARGGLLQHPPSARAPGRDPVAAVVDEIFRALVSLPLNARQKTILSIYHDARKSAVAPLEIQAVASELAHRCGPPMGIADATQFVRGALRSFGKRLNKTLSRPPAVLREEIEDGELVADTMPLLAMFDIGVGQSGQTAHRLTGDGFAAVSLVLGLPTGGSDEDENATVSVGMSRLAGALLMRVAASMDLSVDAAVKYMTAQAGAG